MLTGVEDIGRDNSRNNDCSPQLELLSVRGAGAISG